jgi:hypothetical protein
MWRPSIIALHPAMHSLYPAFSPRRQYLERTVRMVSDAASVLFLTKSSRDVSLAFTPFLLPSISSRVGRLVHISPELNISVFA